MKNSMARTDILRSYDMSISEQTSEQLKTLYCENEVLRSRAEKQQICVKQQQSMIHSLESRVLHLQNAEAQLCSCLKQAKKQLKTADDEVRQLRLNLEKRDQLIRTLDSRQTCLQDENIAVKRKIKQISAEKTELLAQLTSRQKENGQLKTQLDSTLILYRELRLMFLEAKGKENLSFQENIMRVGRGYCYQRMQSKQGIHQQNSDTKYRKKKEKQMQTNEGQLKMKPQHVKQEQSFREEQGQTRRAGCIQVKGKVNDSANKMKIMQLIDDYQQIATLRSD